MPECRDCADFGPVCPYSKRPCGEAQISAETLQALAELEAEDRVQIARENAYYNHQCYSQRGVLRSPAYPFKGGGWTQGT